MSKYGILVAESSLDYRMAIKNAIQKTPPFEMVGTAIKEAELYKKAHDKNVSLIVLDSEFARSGIDILSNMAKQTKIPILFMSSHYAQTTEAYERGAAMFLLKTHIGEPMSLFEKRFRSSLKQILPQVKSGIEHSAKCEKEISVEPKHHPDELLRSEPLGYAGKKIIAIGASMGGAEALSKVFTKLPLGLPPIVVAQHMPLMFSKNFVSRLNLLCKLSVVEARDGEVLNDSTVYFAPGDSHLIIEKSKQNGRYTAKVVDAVKISRHRPSIDILFRSVNNCAGSGAMAIIMTGMGDDGSIGIKELFDNNAYTLAQSESSSAVYGLAKSAVNMGAIKKIMDLDEIATEIVAFYNNECGIS